MLDRVVLADCTVLDGAEHGRQRLELHLREVELAQERWRKVPQLLRRLHQPPQHGVWVHRQDTGGRPDAHAFSQARDATHEPFDRYALALDNGAMGLEHVAPTANAVKLAPRPFVGLTVRAQMAQTGPAVIHPVGMRTVVLEGIHLTRTAIGQGHRRGGRGRGRLGRRRFWLTPSTVWPVGETGKGCGLSRALTPGWLWRYNGRRGRLAITHRA
jgi:hypothetical protein